MKGLPSAPPSPGGATAAYQRLRALLSPGPPVTASVSDAAGVSAVAPSADPAAEHVPAAATSARGRRFDLGLPGARALVAVGVATVLVAAGYLWLARPRPESVPAAEIHPSVQPSALSAPSASAASVVVHVAGKVRRPGVITLPAGSRVTDAIKAAGGLRPGAKIGTLNLARHVVDGEQIPVGIGAPPAPGPPGAGSSAAPGAQVDLNTATVEQFDQLPGVGPVLAQRIIEYRTQHGPFRSVDQLQEVNGIGDQRYAELKDLVRV